MSCHRFRQLSVAEEHGHDQYDRRHHRDLATIAGVGLVAAILFVDVHDGPRTATDASKAVEPGVIAPIHAGTAGAIQARLDMPGSIAIPVQPGTGDAVKASKDVDLGSVSNVAVNIAPGTGDAIRASKDMGAR